MRHLRWLAICMLLALCACATKNVGRSMGAHGPANVTITVPANIAHGRQGTFTANWQGGIGKYTVVWDFNGGIQEGDPAPQLVNGPPVSATAAFQGSTLGPTTGSVTVKVTDSRGQSASSTATFTVPVIPNLPPTLTNSVTGNTVTVTVEDLDGDDVDITWTATGGSGAPATATVTGGAGTANFTFSPDDILAGGDVVVEFTVSDTFGNTDTATATVTQPQLGLQDDTIYAIPLQSSAHIGEPVRIVVATGTPANPFFYMSSLRVTAPAASGFEYVPNSFNAGAPGGATGDPDGIWGGMGVNNFLLPPDNFIQRSFITGPDPSADLWAIDFNLTPLDGSQSTTASGALFNFQATFDAPGTWRLGFQQTDVVDRTYYQDTNLQPNYFWGDITNDHPGVPNSVTVE